MGTLGFIIAREGDLRGAAQTYRDAITAATSSRVFGEDATSTSADVADLEAALGSVCFAASDESEESPEAKRANELESVLASKNTRPTRDERDEATRARREADAAERRRRAEAAAALEEAVGCFSRAADVARRAWGTRSGAMRGARGARGRRSEGARCHPVRGRRRRVSVVVRRRRVSVVCESRRAMRRGSRVGRAQGRRRRGKKRLFFSTYRRERVGSLLRKRGTNRRRDSSTLALALSPSTPSSPLTPRRARFTC